MRVLTIVVMCLGISTAVNAYEFWPGARYADDIPSFQSALGYPPGERISAPEDVLRYFEALARAAPERMRLVPYATSWEGRTLFYAVIGSAQNMARLTTVQQGMQSLAQADAAGQDSAEALIASLPGSVWLAYAVHGNEISSTDAAMLTAYHLLAARNEPVASAVMADTLVFLDPLQNPDGRARFVHGFRQAQGLRADSDRLAAEHDEPWPSGRVNHYLFDMNRDWIALTQPETRGRVAALLEWYPLVFVDLHEMGSDSTYYFAPEAIPYNPHLAADQRNNLTLFGRNNAAWFDRFGIDYFTREVFDAFYPGYGASWPAYYGAVAMTYEQASARGLAMRRQDGSEFHYRETVRNHFVTSLATAETVARNREKLLRDYYNYRLSAIAEGSRGPLREYILSSQPDPSATDKLAGLLVNQGVAVRRARAPFSACGQDYDAGSYAVSLAQPAKRLIRTLLDPQVDMEAEFLREQERRRAKDLPDEIYDVTAWSLPLMFNIASQSCNRPVNGDFEPASAAWFRPATVSGGADALAYLVPWGTRAAGRFLAAALDQGLAVKSSDKAFTIAERRYPAGSLILKVAENSTSLADRVQALAQATGAPVFGVADSWVTDGPNFGSGNVVRMLPPRIAIAWDEPTSSSSGGHARFVLERQFGYPVTAIRTATLARAELARYQVIVLPQSGSGDYMSAFGDAGAARLQTWVEKGGTLIVLGNAMRYATHPKIDLLSTRREDAFQDRDEKEDGADDEENSETGTVPGTRLTAPADYVTAIQPKREAPDTTSGALVRATVDGDHWLAAGVQATLPAMVIGSDIYSPLRRDAGVNIAHFAGSDELLASGYLWDENRQQLAYKPFVMLQPRQRGFVIGFTEDPNYRAYLDGLNVIFLNAVFRAPAHASPVR